MTFDIAMGAAIYASIGKGKMKFYRRPPPPKCENQMEMFA